MLAKQISFACALLISNTQASKLRAQGFFDEDPFSMPDPFGGSSFFGSRRHQSPFSNDGFGFGGFGDMGNAFNGMDQQMERMHNSFDQPFAGMGGDGQSKSFSSSFSSSQGADGQVHKKQSKSGQQTQCHNGICKVVSCADGKCKESSQKADDLAKQANKQRGELMPHRHHSSPFGAMEGMFGGMGGMGGMPDIEDQFRKARRHSENIFGNARRQMDSAMRDMASPEQMMKKMAGAGGKVHSESSAQSSSMKCANGKCEKTTCMNGKCKVEVTAQPGLPNAGAQENNNKMVMEAPQSPQDQVMARKQVEAAVDNKQKELEKKNAQPVFAKKNNTKTEKSTK